MKDYSRALENTDRASLQRIIPFRTGQPLTEWNTLQVIESAAFEMRGRLKAVLPSDLNEEVNQVKLELFNAAEAGCRLLLKAQLYRLSSRETLLKVFAHQVDNRGHTTKLARAVYHINISRQGHQQLVA